MTATQRLEDLESDIEDLLRTIVQMEKNQSWKNEEFEKRITELEQKVRALEVGFASDPFGMRGI